MKFTSNIFYIFVIITISSCSKDILTIKSNFEVKLCLSGFVCPDSSYVVVSLNDTIFVDDTVNRRIMLHGNETQVVLYENGLFFDSLRSSARSISFWSHNVVEYYYVSQKKAKLGSTYKIKVLNNKYPTVYATTKIPDTIALSKVDTVREKVRFGDNYREQSFLECTFNDPVDEENNYLFLRRIETEPYIYISSDSLMSKEFGSLALNTLYDNYKNKQDDEILSYRVNYAFLNDTYFQGKQFSFRYWLDNNYPDSIAIKVYSISDEYYKYNLSLYNYYKTQYDSNSEPVTIFSNVENGYGIFMGFSNSEYKYRLR